MVMLRYAVGSIPILFSAPPGKLSNTMVRYPDTLSLFKARALFFRDAKHSGRANKHGRKVTASAPKHEQMPDKMGIAQPLIRKK